MNWFFNRNEWGHNQLFPNTKGYDLTAWSRFLPLFRNTMPFFPQFICLFSKILFADSELNFPFFVSINSFPSPLVNRDYESCLCFEKKKKAGSARLHFLRSHSSRSDASHREKRKRFKKKMKMEEKEKINEWKEEEEETNRYLGLFFFWMGGGLCRFVGRNSTCRPGKSSTWNIRLYLLGPYILASGRTAWLYQSVSSYGPVETRSLLLLSLSPIFASFFLLPPWHFATCSSTSGSCLILVRIFTCHWKQKEKIEITPAADGLPANTKVIEPVDTLLVRLLWLSSTCWESRGVAGNDLVELWSRQKIKNKKERKKKQGPDHLKNLHHYAHTSWPACPKIQGEWTLSSST